jgi:hypothetical protein
VSRRIGAALVLLAALFLLLQGAAQAAASGFASGALSQRLGGRVRVSVRAMPFWRLFSGQFDRLAVSGRTILWDHLHVASVSALWQDGRVDVASLLHGREVLAAFQHTGRLTVSLSLTAGDVYRLLPATGALRFTGVRLAGRYVDLDGVLDLYGARVPFSLRGEVAPAPGGAALVYRLDGLESGPLSLRHAVRLEVASLRPLGVYPFVRYRSAQVRHGLLVVRLGAG